MKKWMYLVFPGAMLALFLVVYTTHVKEAEQKDIARKAALAQKLEKDAAEKKANEARAAEDAKKRQEERDAEDRKKEEERRKKKEAMDKEIRDDMEKYRAEADASAKTAAQLEIELDRLRKERDTLNREDFALAKDVETARIAKQNAEIKQQQMTAQIAMRAQNSTMASIPVQPAPKR